MVALIRWALLRRDTPDLAHIGMYEEITAGPVQRDEALLLFALVRVTRPQTVVEMGFSLGQSAFNFLRAMDPDARLYSFDVEPICAGIAARRFADEPRFAFRARPQDEITRADLDGRVADLVLIDGAHELAVNQRTFERLLDVMSPTAVVAVHDTGTVAGRFIEDWRVERSMPERWIGDEYEHQPAERAFVNWIRAEHPEFAQLHLHTHRTPRHGLTLLQRSAPLPRPPGIG